MTRPDRIYPARCPGCGAPILGALFTDERVPHYACGSIPDRIVCRPAPGPYALENVEPVAIEDLDGLYELAASLSSATHVPIVAVCAVVGCDATAIDGLCLGHLDKLTAGIVG